MEETHRNASLSAEEMLKAVKYASTEVPQRGGIKDYAPDGSWLQAKKIESFYKEHYDALSEERIKKLGGTAIGDWNPTEGKVEVLTTPGKFWGHMGHVVEQVKWLYPEESLFLIDQGLMEVSYNGVPMTVQQAYSSILGGSYPIERYQVYSHLRRLGFIVRRHEAPSSTKYERQLRIDKETKSANKKRRRRKINPESESQLSPEDVDGVLESKRPKVDAEHTASDQMEIDITKETTEVAMETGRDAIIKQEEASVRHIDLNCPWTRLMKRNETSCTRDTKRWDFSELCFPDLSSLCLNDQQNVTIPIPSPHLLPFSDRQNVSPFTLSSKCLRYTPKEVTVQHQGALEFSYPCVKPKVITRATNWKDYKLELKNKTDKELMSACPASVLWSEDDIKPLVSPKDAFCTANILSKLKVIDNVSTTTSNVYSHVELPIRAGLEISFDVYLPNAKYKKSCPGMPDHRICVMRQDDGPPTLSEIAGLNQLTNDGVPLHWAVVDDGSPAFYRFVDVDIPIDITLG